MKPIERTAHKFGSLDGVDDAFVSALTAHRLRGEEPPPMPSTTVTEPAVDAYVNHGRWVGDCPFCPSASMVSPDDPRFFCAECANAAVGGQYVPVAFPADVERIENELVQRPVAANRNWQPGETATDLAAETVAFFELPDVHGAVTVAGDAAPKGGV